MVVGLSCSNIPLPPLDKLNIRTCKGYETVKIYRPIDDHELMKKDYHKHYLCVSCTRHNDFIRCLRNEFGAKYVGRMTTINSVNELLVCMAPNIDLYHHRMSLSTKTTFLSDFLKF